MAQKYNQPKINPIVKSFSSQKTDTKTVQLKGFVGEGPKGFIRIYFSLDLFSYADIPEADIIHFIEPEKDDSPIKLFVKASAEVKCTVDRTYTTKAYKLRKRRAFPVRRFTNPALRPVSDDEVDCFRDCAYWFRDCLRYWDDYDLCSFSYDQCCWACEVKFPADEPDEPEIFT